MHTTLESAVKSAVQSDGANARPRMRWQPRIQVATFLLWASARFLLYSSFFTIVGALFTYRSFGRIVGLISTATGLIGLLQLPLTDLAIERLDGNFLPLQIGAAVIVAALYVPAVLLLRFEWTG